MRRLPDAAAGAGARIAAVDPRDAGRRRAAPFAAGAIPGTGPQIHTMDLGNGFRAGGDGSLRAVYRIYPALADGTGKSGIRRVEPAGAADFSGHHVERMAIHDDTPRGAGDGDAGGTWRDGLPAAEPARVRAGAGLSRGLHGAGDSAAGVRGRSAPQ